MIYVNGHLRNCTWVSLIKVCTIVVMVCYATVTFNLRLPATMTVVRPRVVLA